MDYDIPKYENKIAEESRIYSIYLDSKELAHYIILHEKYAPKDDYKKLDLDIMYETIIGGYFKYTEREKDTIKTDISEACNELPIYKHISDIEIREKEFEKTTTNKIKR